MTVLDIGFVFPGGPIWWVPLGSTVEQALKIRLARRAATANIPTVCFFIFIYFLGSTGS